jgi:hypothetical protein
MPKGLVRYQQCGCFHFLTFGGCPRSLAFAPGSPRTSTFPVILTERTKDNLSSYAYSFDLLPPDPSPLSRRPPSARGERFSGPAAAAFADNFPFPAQNQSMTANPTPGLSVPYSLFPVPCSLFPVFSP